MLLGTLFLYSKMLNFPQKNKITEPSRLFKIFFGAQRVTIFLKNKKN
jgi:hypothetical protein